MAPKVPPFLDTTCGGRLVLPSYVIEHLRAHPEVLDLLEELGELLELPRDGSLVLRTVDFGRVIGRSGAVETAEVGLDEPAMFAQRVGRTLPSRVEQGLEGPEVATLVVVAGAMPRQEEAGVYRLYTCYIGAEVAPKEPNDPTLTRGSKEFDQALAWWRSHALVYAEDSGWEPPFVSTWREVLDL